MLFTAIALFKLDQILSIKILHSIINNKLFENIAKNET